MTGRWGHHEVQILRVFAFLVVRPDPHRSSPLLYEELVGPGLLIRLVPTKIWIVNW